VQDMPEYVYALFEFFPENPDEINFKPGDRIEIIEKDDVYGDGWWQVSPLRSAGLSHSIRRPFWSGLVLADNIARGERVL
jgi:hypothetical protein